MEIKNDYYFEQFKKDKSYQDQMSPIYDGTRDHWKIFGNYKEKTIDKIAKEAKRL